MFKLKKDALSIQELANLSMQLTEVIHNRKELRKDEWPIFVVEKKSAMIRTRVPKLV